MNGRCTTAALLAATTLLATEVVQGADSNRYDAMIFVCRSLDPTNSRLNLRAQPHGIVKDTISRQEIFFLWGRQLHQPRSGYVPIYFRRPSPSRPAQTAADNPAGWVWKDFITCELSN